jgi:hypothetical protein
VGGFQDCDESAHYEYLCRKNGVEVIYCTEQFNNDQSNQTSNINHQSSIINHQEFETRDGGSI